mmetsp:Transcript_20926/g.42461  ORF Transcript_20926/g.42461 Transcript_20926/m.42461 type:complete len:251 (+) Transcript_20926:958-1710(+)
MAGEAREEVKAAAAALTKAWRGQIEVKEASAQLPAVAGNAYDCKYWATTALAREKAHAIVACTLETLGESAATPKLRMLCANLNAPMNSVLRERVLCSKVPPHELVTMSHDELAAPAVRIQRMTSRDARKRAVTIPGHEEGKFGITYEGQSIVHAGRQRERGSREKHADTPEQPTRAGAAHSKEQMPKDGAAVAVTAGEAEAVAASARMEADDNDEDNDDEVQEVGMVTYAERDARGRAAAIIIDDSDGE